MSAGHAVQDALFSWLKLSFSFKKQAVEEEEGLMTDLTRRQHF